MAKPGRRKPSSDMILYGIHTVEAALANDSRKITSIMATRNAADRIKSLLETRKINPQIVSAGDLDRLVGKDAVHQGIIARVLPLVARTIADIEPHGIVVLLDQITDPHNVGAILRSCAAFNVQALITTSRNSPQNSAILAKSASGGLEHVPIIEVTNLSRAIAQLQDMNFTTIGLDSEADTDLQTIPVPAPYALILGAEGKGLRHKTRQNCDFMARLDMPGAIKSLNVSNAAAICLYALNSKCN